MSLWPLGRDRVGAAAVGRAVVVALTRARRGAFVAGNEGVTLVFGLVEGGGLPCRESHVGPGKFQSRVFSIQEAIQGLHHIGTKDIIA